MGVEPLTRVQSNMVPNQLCEQTSGHLKQVICRVLFFTFGEMLKNGSFQHNFTMVWHMHTWFLKTYKNSQLIIFMKRESIVPYCICHVLLSNLEIRNGIPCKLNCIIPDFTNYENGIHWTNFTKLNLYLFI